MELKFNKFIKLILISIFLCLLNNVSYAKTIVEVVAAENFYGELTKEIGGKYVHVKSIISNPNADPHLFAVSPSIAKSIIKADIIIYNGAGYDSWMEQILSSQTFKTKPNILNVAKIRGVKEGDNPHIWYDPDTMPIVAQNLALIISDKLSDKEAKTEIKNNLAKFLKDYKVVTKKVQSIRAKYSGFMVTATEPVFGYMAQALGFNMQGLDFQWKIMNNTEPTPLMVAKYQELILKHKVGLLFYNSQVTDSTTKHILEVARTSQVPIVGVSETMPSNSTIIDWFMRELSTIEAVLKKVSFDT